MMPRGPRHLRPIKGSSVEFIAIKDRVRMFSRNRKTRFAVVSLLPLLLLGLWLADGGFKRFVPSHYHASCNRGTCTSWESEQPMGHDAGVFLGSPFSGGAVLVGDLSAWIFPAGSAARRFISIPANRAEPTPCFLSYFDRLEHQSFIAGALKTDSVMEDVFELQCGGASIPYFRFVDKDLQVALVGAWNNNAQSRAEFYADQKRISILAFFAPFVAFGFLWLAGAALYGIVRYVWDGSVKGSAY